MGDKRMRLAVYSNQGHRPQHRYVVLECLEGYEQWIRGKEDEIARICVAACKRALKDAGHRVYAGDRDKIPHTY